MFLQVKKKAKIRRWISSKQDTVKAMGQMSVLALRAQPLCFFALMLLQCLQGVFPLATAWVMKTLFDLLGQSLQGHVSPVLMQHLWVVLAIQALVLVCSGIISPASQYFNAELTRKLTMTMKCDIYRKINSIVGLAYFEDPEFHDTIQAASNSVQIGPLQALGTFTSLVQGTITLLSFLGVLIAFNPLLTGIIMFAVIPQLYVQFKLSNKRFDLVMMNSPEERRASYYSQILSLTQYIKELRLFNAGDYFLRKFIATTEEIYRGQRSEQLHALCWQLLLALLAGVVSTLAFIVVVMQTFSGWLSLGDVALYASAIASVQAALTNLVFALSRSNDSVLFFSQYTKLLSLEQPFAVSKTRRAVRPLTSGITLRDVSFRYSKQHSWVLRHINFFLPAHQCLALVGLNGSGKTTLVKLLTRLYDPTEGQILWDGIDIREFDPSELRRHMSAIFQDFSRYDLSVQENIGLGDRERIEDLNAIQKAAMKAGIHERVEALPRGYQSILSKWLAPRDEGIDFSGGEWQKLAVARMFMRDAEMLILDEPTAALDVESEYALYQHFKGLMQGHTCLLITHRFSTVRMADCIAVLENGCITEVGTHTELLAHGQTYAQFYTMQAESYKDV
ncbi:multidrug ABC transporter permease [Reticulibacter mediterranei]|uniref:Multidrug ABC transporter permease n=1 Tax=Reticulibacter mediterranei TaxID=2778369 RepID=A0A8J3I930_9CHLR|nr:ABC transporter ATP-binding protein [Reticulibacter mediterranei]GHO91124.1 multidrug ABC transporter permease [Reticulibacter mediterranei]